MNKSTSLFLAMLSGCATGAKTWPEVADGHAIISACVVCWLALMVVWLIRGAPRIHIDAHKKEGG